MIEVSIALVALAALALRHAARTQVQLDSSSQYSSPRSLHLFSLLDTSLPPDSSIDRSAQPSTDMQ